METKKRGRPPKPKPEGDEKKLPTESAVNRKPDGKFGPGNCANPGGRPKMSPEEREAWKALATKCREKIEALVDLGEIPPATLAKFAEVALDRAYGKAVQAVELGDPDGNSFMLSIEDRRNRFNELLEKAKNDGK